MGSYIEINDTLQLTAEQGFPTEILKWETHKMDPIKLESIAGRVFHFQHKDSARIFHLDPVRVFLVENINGKWLFWGHALIQSQHIAKVHSGPGWKPGQWETSGTFIISSIHDPDYQKLVTIRESPKGKSFFDV